MSDENTVNKGGVTADYMTLFLNGMSTPEIMYEQKKTGVPTSLFSIDYYRDNLVKNNVITEDQLNEVYPKAYESYYKFKSNQYNGNVTEQFLLKDDNNLNRYLYGDSHPFLKEAIGTPVTEKKHSLAEDYSGKRVLSYQQAATRRGDIDYNGKKYTTVDEFKDAETSFMSLTNPVLELEFDDDGPKWVGKNYNEEINRSVTRMAWGDQKLHNNFLVSVLGGVVDPVIQLGLGGTGTLLTWGNDMFDFATDGEIDITGEARRSGNMLINAASKLMIKPSEAQMESPFSSAEALSWGVMQVVGQLMLQFATSGLTSAAGLSPAAAMNTSIGSFSVLMMDASNEMCKDNNIADEDRLWILPLFGAACFATERFIGPNIFNTSEKYIYTKSAVVKELNGALKSSLEKAGVKTANELTKNQKGDFVLNTAKYLNNKLFSKEFPISMGGMMRKGAAEEGMEEVVENGIDEVLMSMHDYYRAATGSMPGEGMFNEMNTKEAFLPQFLRRLPNGMPQEATLGAIGGFFGGAVRGISLLNKSAKNHIEHMVAQGHEKEALEYIESLRKDKLAGPDWTDGVKIFNELRTEDDKSLNDQRADMLRDMVVGMVQVRDEYGIRSPEALKAIGGRLNLLDESIGYAAAISKSKEDIQSLEVKERAGTPLTDEEVKLKEDLTASIKINEEKLKEIINPEHENTPYSKRYNEIVKENVIVQEHVKKAMEETYPNATAKQKQSEAYNRALNEYYNEFRNRVGKTGYNRAYNFNKEYTAWEKSYFDNIEKQKQTRTEEKDVVGNIISSVKNIKSGTDFNTSVNSLISELNKIGEVKGGVDSEQLKGLKSAAKSAFDNAAKQFYGDEAQDYFDARKLTGDERNDAINELGIDISEATPEEMGAYNIMKKAFNNLEESYGKVEGLEEQKPIEVLGEQQRRQKFYNDEVAASLSAASSVIDVDPSSFNEKGAREELNNALNKLEDARIAALASNSFYNREGKPEESKNLNDVDKSVVIDNKTYQNVEDNIKIQEAEYNRLNSVFEKLTHSRNIAAQKEYQNKLSMRQFAISVVRDHNSGKMSQELITLIDDFNNNEIYEKLLSKEYKQDNVKLEEKDIQTLYDIEQAFVEIESMMNAEKANIFDSEGALEDLLKPFLENTYRYYTEMDDYGADVLLKQMQETDRASYVNMRVNTSDASYVHYVNFLFRVYAQSSNDVARAWKHYMANNKTDIHATGVQQESIELANAVFIESLKPKDERIYERIFKIESEYQKIYRKSKKLQEDSGEDKGKYRIQNSILFRGLFGTGKTNVLAPHFFMFRNSYRSIINGANVTSKPKVVIVAPTKAVETMLIDVLKDVVDLGPKNEYVVTPTQLASGKVDLSDKTIVWDEFSLVNDENLEKIKETIESQQARLIALVDDKQMKDINNVLKFGYYTQIGIKAPILTTKYSTDIPMINNLSEVFRVARESGANLVDTKIKFPLLWNELVNGVRVGGQYYGAQGSLTAEDKVVEAFIKAIDERKTGSKGLVVFNEKHFNSLAKRFEKLKDSAYKDNVFYIAKNIFQKVGNGQIDSVQGLRREEIYLAIRLEDLRNRADILPEGINELYQGIEADVGYTAVGRASKGIFLVGNTKMNAKSKNEVSWVLPGETKDFNEEVSRAVEFDKNRFDQIANDDLKTETPKGTLDDTKDNLNADGEIPKKVLESIAKKRATNVKLTAKEKKIYLKNAVAITDLENKFKTKPEVFKSEQEDLPSEEMKGITLKDVYIDNDGKMVVVDHFFEKDGVDYVLANNKEYTLNDFKKFEKLDFTTPEDKKFFAQQAKAGKFNIWGSSYTVFGVTNIEDVKKVRQVSPVMMAMSDSFKKTLYYVKEGDVWNEEGTNTVPEKDILLVGVQYTDKGRTDFINALAKRFGKKSAIYKEFNSSQTVPGNYAYLLSLGATEFSYDENNKITDHSNLGEVEEIINNGFKSDKVDHYKKENKEVNIIKARLRNYGYNKWTPKMGNTPIPLTSDISFGRLHQTVSYNSHTLAGEELSGKIAEFKAKGINIGEISFANIGDVNKVPRVIVKYSWDNNFYDDQYFIAFMPKMRAMSANEIKENLRNDNTILNTIKNGGRKNKDDAKFIKVVNSKIRQTSIYNLIANNKSVILGNKILSDYYGKYITFVGNTVRVLDAKTLKKNGYEGKKTGFELEAEIYKLLAKGPVVTDKLTKGQKSKLSKLKLAQEDMYQPLMLEGDYTTPVPSCIKKLLTNVNTINSPSTFVNTSEFYNNEINKDKTEEEPTSDDPFDFVTDDKAEAKGEQKKLPRRYFTTKAKVEELIRQIAGEDFLNNNIEFKPRVTVNLVEAWGGMFNGRIKYELSKLGIKKTTGKHELLHVVLDYVLDEKSVRALLNEAKTAMNLSGEYSGEITDGMAHEWMARTYGRSGTKLINNKKGFTNSWYTPSGMLQRFKAFLDKIFRRAVAKTPLLNQLMYELDSGVYREQIKNLNTSGKNIIRAEEKEVVDEDKFYEDAEVGVPKSKYDNYSDLKKVFGYRTYVDKVRMVLEKELYDSCFMNPNPKGTVAPSMKAARKGIIDKYSKYSVLGDSGTSFNRLVGEMDSTDFVNADRTNKNDKNNYIRYQLSKPEVLNTFMKKIVKDLDFLTLDTFNYNKTNVINDSIHVNYEDSITDFVEWVVSMTPQRHYDSKTGKLLPAEPYTYINKAVATSIFEATGTAMLKEYGAIVARGGNANKLDLFFSEMEKINNADEDIMGDTIKSLISHFYKNTDKVKDEDEQPMSIRERMNSFLYDKDVTNRANKDKAIKMMKYLNAFINAYSIGKRSQMMMEKSTNRKGDSTYEVIPSHNNYFEDIKNRLITSIKGTLYGDDGTFMVDSRKAEEFNNKYSVDKNGLKRKGVTDLEIIKVKKIASGYDIKFTDDADAGMVKTLAKFLGIKLSNNTLTKIFDNEAKVFAAYLKKSNTAIGKNMTQKDLLAEGLYNMVIALDSNIDATKYYNSEYLKAIEDPINPKNEKEANIVAKEKLSKYKFIHSDIIESYRKRIGASNIDGQISSLSDREDVDVYHDIKLPKPYDYFRFLNALGKVEEYVTGGSTKDRFSWTAAGSKIFNYFHKAFIQDLFVNGSKGIVTKFQTELNNMTPEELAKCPLINKEGKKLNLLLGDYGVSVEWVKDNAGFKVKKRTGTDKLSPPDKVEVDFFNWFNSINKQGQQGSMSITLTPLADKNTSLFSGWNFPGVKLVDGFDFSDIELIEHRANEFHDLSLQAAKRHNELSIQRWKSILNVKSGEINDVASLEKFLVELQKAINTTGQSLVDVIESSDLLEVGDYNLKGNKITIGNATRFGLKVDGMTPNTTVFSMEAYEAWNAVPNPLEPEGIKLRSKLRDRMYESDFKAYARVMSQSDFKVPQEVSERLSGAYDYYRLPNDGSKNIEEWNPVFKAHYYSQLLLNSHFNDLIMGHPFFYKNSSARDKRYGSKNTGGSGLIQGPYGVGKVAHVIMGKDNKITFKGEDGKDVTVEVGDGQSWGCALFKRFFDHSSGGEYGPNSNTMQKSIYNGYNLKEGLSVQHKEAVDYINGDSYKKSHVMRFLQKMMLQQVDENIKALGLKDEQGKKVDISIYDKFIEFYDNGNGVRTAKDFNNAMDRLHKWIEEDSGHSEAIRNSLVWKYQNKSGTKTMRRRINDILLREGLIKNNKIVTEEIETDGIKTILNLHQNVNSNSTVGNPIQLDALTSVGNNNRGLALEISNINNQIAVNALKEIQDDIDNTDISDYTGKYKKEEKFRRYLRQLGIDKMPDIEGLANVKDIINDKNISLDFLDIRNRLNTFYRNYVNKEAIRIRMSGYLGNQTTGYVISKYVDQDGTPWLLDELEDILGREIDISETTVEDEYGDTYRLERLLPMRKGDVETIRGEVVAPYMYTKEFNVRPGETINQFFSFHINETDEETGLKTGYYQYFKHKIMKKGVMRSDFLEDFDIIDKENTPLLRDINIERTGALENLSDYDYKNMIFEMYYERILHFNESLNIVTSRTPGTGLGSAGIQKLIAWTNDNGNVVYYADEKNDNDDTDNDGDQIALIHRSITPDGRLAEEGNGKLYNDKINIYDKIFKDKSNEERIFISSNIDELEMLADEIDDNTSQIMDSYASTVVGYTSGRQGNLSIGIAANAISVYDYLAGLGEDVINEIAPGFTHINKTIDGVGKNSIPVRLKDWIQAILDNANTNILGRLKITSGAVSTALDMVESGMTNKEIVDFFKNKIIQRVNNYAALGDKVSANKAKFDLLDKINNEIEYAKKNSTVEEGEEERRYTRADIKSLEEEQVVLEREINDADTEIENYEREGIADENTIKDVKEYSDIAKSRVVTIINAITAINNLELLEKYREHVVRAYAARNLSQILSSRKGLKALDFAFESYASDVQLSLGMTIQEFIDGKEWTIENHLAYYKENSNTYLHEVDSGKKEALLGKETEIAEKMNVVEVLRRIPHINTYVQEIGNQIEREKNTSILKSDFGITARKLYLKSINNATWDYSRRLTSFNHAFQTWINSIWFNENVKEPVSLPMISVIDGVVTPIKSIYDSIDLSDPDGRAEYMRRFTSYVSELKDALDDGLNGEGVVKALTGVEDIEKLRQSEFIKRVLVARRQNRDYVSLADAIQLGQDEALVAQLSSSFEALPDDLKYQFQLYEIMLNELRFRKGSMMDIMGTGIYKVMGMSKLVDGLRDRISSMSVEEQNDMAKQFVIQAQHEQNLGVWYNEEMFSAGQWQDFYLGKEEIGNNYSRTVLYRHTGNGNYVKEYIGNSKISNAYNGFGKANVTSIQPLFVFNHEDLNVAERSTKTNPITKTFLGGHNYKAFIAADTFDEEGNTISGTVPVYYLTENGLVMHVVRSTKTSVSFANTGLNQLTEDQITQINKEKEKSYPVKDFEAYNGRTIDRHALRRVIRQIEKVVPGLNVYEVDGEGMKAMGESDETKAFFEYKGNLYCNYENFSEATGIHELVHLFLPVVKLKARALYDRMVSEAEMHINNQTDLYLALKHTYGSMDHQKMVGEIMATLGGFNSVEGIREWLGKMNYKGDYNYANTLWGNVKSWIKDFVNAIKSFFSSSNGKIWSLDFERATLRDFFDALVVDFQEGNMLLDLNKEDISILSYSVEGREASKPLRKPVEANLSDIRDIVPIINNNTGDIKAIADLDEEGLINHFYKNIKINDKGEKTLWYRNKSYSYSSSMSAEQIKESIKTSIIVERNKAIEQIPSQVKSFIKAVSSGEDVMKSARAYFSNGQYDSNMTYNVANRLVSIFHATEPIQDVMKYSELKDSPTLKHLYKPGFTGFDPLVVIHSIEDGVVNLSLIDINITDLGFHTINVENNKIFSTLQSSRQSERDGVDMNNSDGDIKKLLLGMTMMAMSKGNNIKIRTLGAVQFSSKKTTTRLVQDISSLLKTIKVLANNDRFAPMLAESNSLVNTILTDESLYEKDYKQSLLDRLNTYYESKNEQVKYNEMQQVLENPDNSMQDLLALFISRRDKLENELGDSKENDAEYKLLGQALVELGLNRDPYTAESMQDMTHYEKELGSTHVIKSQLLQGIIEKVMIVKNIIVKDTYKYLEDVKGLTASVIDRFYTTTEGKVARGTSRVKDEGSKYFKRMVVKTKVVVKSILDENGNVKKMKIGGVEYNPGDEVEVLIPKLHHSLKDDWTRQAYDRGEINDIDLKYTNMWLDHYEKREIQNLWWRKVKHQGYTDNKGKATFTIEQAFEEFHKTYSRGDIPVMNKSFSELLWKGDFKSAFKRFSASMENVEEYMEDEVENTLTQENINKVSSVFEGQVDRINQLRSAGLEEDENGNLFLVNDRNNEKMSTNLWKLGAYHQLSSIRKENYEQGVMPYYNAANTVFNLMSTLQLNNKAWLESYINRVVFRKTQDTDERIGKVKVATLVRTAMRGLSTAALAFRVSIGKNSLMWNEIQGITNTIANSIANIGIDDEYNKMFIPSPADYFKAHSIVFTDFKKVKALSDEFQLVNRQEEDLINNPFISPTDRQFIQEQWSHIFNWGTDAYARRVAMASLMFKEGSYKAYSYDDKEGKVVYDWKKDDRFYKNGVQTEQQKALLKGLITDLVAQKILDPKGMNAKELFDSVISGKVELPRGHDYVDSNNFKWFADKFIIGSMDTISKNIMGRHYAGAALQQFRLFAADRLWNVGVFASERHTTAGAVRKPVKINGEWVSVREQILIEGQIQSLRKSWSIIKKFKDMGAKEAWNDTDANTRLNLVKSVMQVTMFLMAYAIMRGFWDDDEKKQKDVVYAFNDIFITFGAYNMLRNPIPIWSALQRVIDVSIGEKEAKELFRYVPGMAVVKDIQDSYNRNVRRFDMGEDDEVEPIYGKTN